MLPAPDIQMGFEVEYALNSWFGVEIGAIMSWPLRANQVVLELCFMPGDKGDRRVSVSGMIRVNGFEKRGFFICRVVFS